MSPADTTLTVTLPLSSSSLLEGAAVASSLRSGSTIEVGRVLGEGAFGRVYEVRSVNRTTPPPYVVKVMFQGTGLSPKKSAQTIADLHAALGRATLPHDAREHLPGLPFWVGTGTLAGQVVHLSIAHNLIADGYQSLDEVLEDPADRNAWLRQPVTNRVAAALHLARAFEILESVGFLHGDVNIENLFVDTKGLRATLIDFDAGSVAPRPPLTCGKFDEFSALEIQALMSDPQAALAQYGPEAERWSVGVTMHFLLFGLGPFFFLRAQTSAVIRDYFASSTWPDIGVGFTGTNQHNLAFHPLYLQDLTDLTTSTLDQLRSFVVDGSLQPTARPSGRAWVASLVKLADPPTIVHLAVSKQSLVSGDEVEIRWSTQDATNVWIDGDGPFPATGSHRIRPERSAPVNLLARNPFGEVNRRTDLIRVFPIPQIRALNLPSTTIRLAPVSVTVPRAPVRGATAAAGVAGVGDAIGQLVTARRPRPPTGMSAAQSRSLAAPGTRLQAVRPARGRLRLPRLHAPPRP